MGSDTLPSEARLLPLKAGLALLQPTGGAASPKGEGTKRI